MLFPGLVNLVPAVACLISLKLPAAFLQPGNGLREIPCNFMMVFLDASFVVQ